MPTADVYPVFKDLIGSGDFDWDAAANRLYAYLFDNTLTAITGGATTLAGESGYYSDSGNEISAEIGNGNRSISGGVYTSTDSAVWTSPSSDAGATKHIVLGWMSTGADPSTLANIVPVCLLPTIVVPQGTTLTVNPDGTNGWFNLNAGL